MTSKTTSRKSEKSPKTPTRYQLAHDNDGHTYIIEVGQEDLFDIWVGATEDDEDCELGFEDRRVNCSGWTFADPQGWA